jgi:tetratricopeptide (TPR) repeat protein
VVSTRPVRQPDPPRSVVEELNPVAVLDLDAPVRRDSGRVALREYVERRLRGVTESMDPAAVAERLVVTSTAPESATDDRPFLLARVVTDQLRAAPVDTGLPEWERYLADSIETAFDVDLARVTAPAGGLPGSAPELARTLLTTLTWAFGAGFPEEEWLAVASRLAGVELGREHVTWVLDQLGRYVVQDGEGGVAVYRVAHQSLADHLRPAYRPTGEQPFDPAARPVWEALAERYAALLGAGVAATAPSYLWQYAYRHAAQVGLPGLDGLRELASADPALQPDIASAALSLASTARTWGRWHDALRPTEEAVEIRRTLAAENPAHLPDLATALGDLGIRYSELGRHVDALSPFEEAVELYRAIAAENPWALPDLGSALNNLAISYSNLGRHADALSLAEEAVQLKRDLAADNPVAVLPDLASALNNLGNRYSNVGRRTDALPPTEEAVRIYRVLASDNPSYLPPLATTLSNLGARYSDLGRSADDLPVTEESVHIRRAVAADNPAYLPDLAMSLSNLGVTYSNLGRLTEALPPTQESIDIRRALTADNPAFLPDLAMSLNNLGIYITDLGRGADALPLIEESTQIRRTLAADNPAYLPDLAMSLSNLGVTYSNLDRLTDSLLPTQESVHIRRTLAADNPNYLPDLATSLNNLGIIYSNVGRPTEALPPTQESVHIRRTLAADNPAAFLPDLAASLINLGARHSDLGQRTDAVAPTEEAVRIRRTLAADNPAFLPDLAGALYSLSVRYSDLGRPDDALPPNEEAVRIRRTLAADNPAFLPDLAGALNNLSVQYSDLGRPDDALPPNEEAADIFRTLAADNPAFLPDLARALNNLGNRYRDRGEAERADSAWNEVVAEHDSGSRAVLLYYRAAAARTDDPRAAAWLAAGCDSTDHGFASAARDEARRRRAGAPAVWDAAWTTASGESPPAWLAVDPDLVAAATTWVDTPTYDDERDHLAAHPELLDPAAEVAVDEALMRIDEDAADRYRQLLAAAREHGVQAAYRPLLLRGLAAQFLQGAPDEQRTLLAERRVDLLDDLVREHLSASAEDDRTGAGERALALLDLADDPALSEAFAALDDPSRFPDLLAAIAHQPDLRRLRPLAGIALSVATTGAEAATAALYFAVAADDPKDAADAIRQARTWHPDGVNGWIALLADLGRTHPAVLPLIPELLKEPDDGEH